MRVHWSVFSNRLPWKLTLVGFPPDPSFLSTVSSMIYSTAEYSAELNVAEHIREIDEHLNRTMRTLHDILMETSIGYRTSNWAKT